MAADAVGESSGPSAAQLRAARAFLGMSQAELAASAGVARLVVLHFEAESTKPRASSVAKIVAALRARGIEFFETTEGVGVLMRHERPLGPAMPG